MLIENYWINAILACFKLNFCCDSLTFPTGLGQGEVLADDGLFSFSSGSSTEDILIFFADNSLRLCTGLVGAKETLN